MYKSTSSRTFFPLLRNAEPKSLLSLQAQGKVNLTCSQSLIAEVQKNLHPAYYNSSYSMWGWVKNTVYFDEIKRTEILNYRSHRKT